MVPQEDAAAEEHDQHMEEAEQESPIGEDLTAAVQFLSNRSEDAGLMGRIEDAMNAKDGMLLTSHLVKGYMAALKVKPQEGENLDVITVNLEGCIQVVMALLKEVTLMHPDLVMEVAEGLCEGEDLGNMRLRSLALLYNSVPGTETKLRYKILLLLIDLGAKLNKVEKLDIIISQLDVLIKGFQLDVEETRTLYGKLADALRKVGNTQSAYNLNVKRLETYNGCSAQELDSMSEMATLAVTDAIGLPKLFRFDSLLDLETVERLKEKNNGTLYRLLEIFIKEELSAFQEFCGANKGFLESHKLDYDQCVDKMRLLTLATLGCQCTELEYQSIATALDIPVDKVEEWIIKAISTGLVETKMNQVTRTITVNRSTTRAFSADQWEPLSEKINVWADSVQKLLSTIQTTRDGGKIAI